MRWLRGGFFGVTYDPIGGGRAREGRGGFLLMQRSESPDAGRGADAEREGILDLGRWVGGERCLILDVEF